MKKLNKGYKLQSWESVLKLDDYRLWDNDDDISKKVIVDISPQYHI